MGEGRGGEGRRRGDREGEGEQTSQQTAPCRTYLDLNSSNLFVKNKYETIREV